MAQDRTDTPIYIDLFSGCGGMSLGFDQAGFESVGAVEINEKAAKTYKENIGVEPLVDDITNYTAKELMDQFGVKKGQLDVVISCAPCQGFSQHRNKDDEVDDERNTLVSFSAELAVEMEPEFFVMENVPELLRDNKSEKEKHWWKTWSVLKDAGYNVNHRVLNAADYGVPQRRHRAIIVARKDGLVAELPEPIQAEKQTVREAISDLPPIDAGEQHSSLPMHRAPNHKDRIVEMLELIPDDGGSWIDIPEENRDEYWLESMHKRAKNGNEGSFSDTYGRMYWDEPAPTITRKSSTPSCGRFAHPVQNRNITPREAARLQTFPDDWEFKGSFVSWYEQNGNAVPPLLANAIARKVIKLFDVDEKAERQATFDDVL